MCAMNPRLLRPLATGFNPRQIAGLSLWLDAADASTITRNGDDVSAWADKSGNGRNFTQGTAAAQPLYATAAMNGRAVVRANGTDHWLLNSGSSVGAASFSMFLVSRHLAWISDASKPANLFTTDLAASGSSNLGFRSEQYVNAESVRFGDADSSQAFGIGSTSANTLNVARVMQYSFEASTRLAQVRRNSVVAGSATVAAAHVPATFGGRFALFVGFQDTSTRRVNAEIAEVIFFSRVVNDAERQKIEGYLAWRWGLQAQLPSNHPYAYSFPGFGSQARPDNGDALAWESAVYSNSGSVSVGTLAAVNTFCNAIESAGIRDRFYRLSLMAGSNLNAALVPLYRGPSRTGTQYGNATDTNYGSFVSADYQETGSSGGLKGDGTNNYLDTGFNVDQLPGAADCHLSSYIRGTQNISSTETLIGTLFNGTTDRYRVFLFTSTAGNYDIRAELGKSNQATGVRANTNGGLILLSRTSTTSLTLYDDAVSIGTNTTLTAETTGAVPFLVFARNGPTEFYNGIMAGYSIGAGMSSEDATSYYNALNAFQTALGRAQA